MSCVGVLCTVSVLVPVVPVYIWSVLKVAFMVCVPVFCVMVYCSVAVPFSLVSALPMGVPFMVKVICFPLMGVIVPFLVSVRVSA